MSDIHDKPDLSRKVRYNRKLEGDGAESEVAIYEVPDNTRDDRTGFQSQEGGAPTQMPLPVQRRSSRRAVVCLGALCLLMGGAIIILSIHSVISNRQLQDEVKKLKTTIEGMCPEGWTRFGCSCYFKLNEKKNWFDSRDDCVERGAHLVIITSEEEQKFITNLNWYGDSWIGLQPVYEQWRYTWKWLDGSALTQGFWATGLSGFATQHSYAACCDDQGKWTRYFGYYNFKTGICEKQISLFPWRHRAV